VRCQTLNIFFSAMKPFAIYRGLELVHGALYYTCSEWGFPSVYPVTSIASWNSKWSLWVPDTCWQEEAELRYSSRRWSLCVYMSALYVQFLDSKRFPLSDSVHLVTLHSVKRRDVTLVTAVTKTSVEPSVELSLIFFLSWFFVSFYLSRFLH